MISVIITTYKETKTLPKVIEIILNEKITDEILVVASDKETEDLIKKKYQELKFLKSEKLGKPAALNLAFREAQGDILILTDGDVFIKPGSIKYLVQPFEDPGVGLVCGKPISLNPKDNLFGFWAHFLCFAAHKMRKKKKIFPCSGNLYALRRKIVEKIPEKTMVDDAIISNIVFSKGYKVIYLDQAQVFVKYPSNFKDWLKQKIRATGGYMETSQTFKMRNLGQEIFAGVKLFFTYPQNLKEFYWTILLYLARIYLWILIFWQIKIRKKGMKELWKRVESTK